MTPILEDIIKNINNATYDNIIQKIQTSSYLNQLTIDFIENINRIEDNKVEPLLKIILNRIIYFNGNINTNYTKDLYCELTKLQNNNVILLDNFITLFDEKKKIKIQYLSLIYQFIRSFGDLFPKLKLFLKKEKLINNDIEIINNLIVCDIYRYFQSIFDLNYNKCFFKRITDCNKQITKDINTQQMIERMLCLCKIFGIKTLHKLNIEIISTSDFISYNYLDRVKYFRMFYIKVHSLFKLYSKYYDTLLDLDNKLLLLINIDPLDYIDELEDSSSSFILSDDNINIISKDIINDKLINDKLINEDISEDMADTPFFRYDNINNNASSEHENTNYDSVNENNEDNTGFEDDESYDFFVKIDE